MPFDVVKFILQSILNESKSELKSDEKEYILSHLKTIRNSRLNSLLMIELPAKLSIAKKDLLKGEIRHKWGLLQKTDNSGNSTNHDQLGYQLSSNNSNDNSLRKSSCGSSNNSNYSKSSNNVNNSKHSNFSINLNCNGFNKQASDSIVARNDYDPSEVCLH